MAQVLLGVVGVYLWLAFPVEVIAFGVPSSPRVTWSSSSPFSSVRWQRPAASIVLAASRKDKHPPGPDFLFQDFKTAKGEVLNPYEVLKVKPTASLEQIKQAYRQLSRKYHADANRFRDILPGRCNNAEEVRDEWERVKLAYEILRNPKLRLRYDRNVVIADPGAAMKRAAIDAMGKGLRGMGSVVGKGIQDMGQGLWSVGALAVEQIAAARHEEEEKIKAKYQKQLQNQQQQQQTLEHLVAANNNDNKEFIVKAELQVQQEAINNMNYVGEQQQQQPTLAHVSSSNNNNNNDNVEYANDRVVEETANALPVVMTLTFEDVATTDKEAIANVNAEPQHDATNNMLAAKETPTNEEQTPMMELALIHDNINISDGEQAKESLMVENTEALPDDATLTLEHTAPATANESNNEELMVKAEQQLQQDAIINDVKYVEETAKGSPTHEQQEQQQQLTGLALIHDGDSSINSNTAEPQAKESLVEERTEALAVAVVEH